MGEWKLFERVWEPPMRWRVKQAWNLLRRGRFDIKMHYMVDNTDVTVFVDDEYVGEVAMGIDPDEPVWEGSQLKNPDFESIRFTDEIGTDGKAWEEPR